MTLTRRGFVKTGGALLVSLAVPPSLLAEMSQPLAAWLEIRSDSTILVRSGRAEIGTGASAFYPQTVAEELRVHPDAITMLMADTNSTTEGGYSAGFLNGAANLRKVAAYTYQALLKLAASHLGVNVASLNVENGVVSGGGKSVSYGDLVQGQQLYLKIPITGKPVSFASAGANSVAGLAWDGLDGYTVAGNPPLKPISEYTVVGTDYPMPGIPDKVTGKAQWSCDVALPGMLHARMIRPATLGSALVAVGELDPHGFPTSRVVRKNTLLAVVAGDEWEAVSAARSVAAGTKWTEWSGLPTSANLTAHIREHKWDQAGQTRGDKAQVNAAFASAAKVVAASFEQPYVKHAPIGPFVAVADVRPDGTATIWSQAGHLQASRARLANILRLPVENVVVKWLSHAGQFGRKTFGGDGAEADAAILSQLTGKPVRVQWSLQEDLAWSAASPGWVSDIKGALDANGNLIAVESSFYSPEMFDARSIGSILASVPQPMPKPGGFIATEWCYDKIPNRLEHAYAMPSLGRDSPVGGLRGLIMRTPGQRQQNFVLECLINEAASTAHADPIEFRLRHTNDQRLTRLVHATAEAAKWEPRPSPHAKARRSGADPVTGRGCCAMLRANAYWMGIAEISVTPSSGVIAVTKFTMGVECGKIINPRQLDRCMKGGLVMGLGEALKEELTFDNGKVTSTDWSTYKILTMQETPEIQVVQLSCDDHGFGGGGEAPNALAPPAVAAAFFDATGVMPRRIPLTPGYVRTLLSANLSSA